MYIGGIKIDHFGPIKHLDFQFRPQGVNAIIGQNAVGKTQLLAAIYAMFFGDKVIRYDEESDETGHVEAQIILPQGRVTLKNRYTNQSAAVSVDTFDTLLEASKIDRNQLYFYFPDRFGRENRVYSREMIRHSYQFLCDLGLQSHHILGTCLAKTETNVVMSIGEERYIELMYFLSHLPKNTVFLGDSLFSCFDNTIRYMILSVFDRMSDRQFILTENPGAIDETAIRNMKLLNLERPSGIRSPASYNYKTIQQKYPQTSVQDEEPDKKEDMIVPIIFCIGKQFPYEECETIELKEVKGNNPCASIIANAEIYINAYLNSRSSETGRIFWGVNDNRIIKGVALSHLDKDTIQKRIAEALSKAQPYISPDIYYIKFNRVSTEAGEMIPGTYIVEIGVAPYHANRLFSTSKGEVYIKTVGGKEKLTALQIQEQIILRTKRLSHR